MECAKLVLTGCTNVHNMADKDGQTPFHAACTSGNMALVELLCRIGVDSLNKPAFLWQKAERTEKWHQLSLSPIAAAVCFHCKGVIRLLRECNLDAESPLVCNTCPLNKCGFGGGCTPIELAERHGLAVALKGKAKCKHTTPVPDHAAKLGLALRPTPDGVRDQLSSSSPSIRDKGRRAMQRHQKACHQLVDRAELKRGRERETLPSFNGAQRDMHWQTDGCN